MGRSGDTVLAMTQANPILVEALRGGIVESAHRGAVAVMDADGTVHTQLGDIERPIFPRSAVKVLQALPLVESGAADRWQLSKEELIAAYLAAVPDRAFADSCIYHAEHGCNLPETMRARFPRPISARRC